MSRTGGSGGGEEGSRETPAMDDLLRGYHRFRADRWPAERDRFESTAREGQRPSAVVLACCDSRVDPQMIFAARPGQLFVVRNVANLAPPYRPDRQPQGTSAALEFGVRALKAPTVIVLGHGMCGGVAALFDEGSVAGCDFLPDWIAQASRARATAMRVAEDHDLQLRAAEHEVVRLSLRNLRTYPWIEERIAAGALRLVGAYFDIRHGELTLMRADGSFASA